MRRPVLVAFAGLPGAGKSTIAASLAAAIRAAYLRVDEVEQALRGCAVLADVGPAGYVVAQALARSNLSLGLDVVADSVNPLGVTREGWRAAARGSGARCLDVEVVCSDEAEHRRRVETRTGDVPGLVLPTWDAVVARRYEREWDGDRLVVDTARISASDAVSTILAGLEPLR